MLGFKRKKDDSLAAMVMAPLVIIFFFAQRFFVEGIKLQGIKG